MHACTRVAVAGKDFHFVFGRVGRGGGETARVLAEEGKRGRESGGEGHDGHEWNHES